MPSTVSRTNESTRFQQASRFYCLLLRVSDDLQIKQTGTGCYVITQTHLLQFYKNTSLSASLVTRYKQSYYMFCVWFCCAFDSPRFFDPTKIEDLVVFANVRARGRNVTSLTYVIRLKNLQKVATSSLELSSELLRAPRQRRYHCRVRISMLHADYKHSENKQMLGTLL